MVNFRKNAVGTEDFSYLCGLKINRNPSILKKL